MQSHPHIYIYKTYGFLLWVEKESCSDTQDLNVSGEQRIGFFSLFTKYLVDYLDDNGDIAICAKEFGYLKKYNKKFSATLLIHTHLSENQFDAIAKLLPNTGKYSLNFTVEDKGSLLHILIQKYAASTDETGKASIKALIKKLVEDKFDQTIGCPPCAYPTQLAQMLDCRELLSILQTSIQKLLNTIFDERWDVLKNILSLSCKIEKFEVVNKKTKEHIFLDEKHIRELLLDKLDVLHATLKDIQSQLDPAFIENLDTLANLSPLTDKPQEDLSDQETRELKTFIISLTKLILSFLLFPERQKEWALPSEDYVYVDKIFIQKLKLTKSEHNSHYSQKQLLSTHGYFASNTTTANNSAYAQPQTSDLTTSSSTRATTIETESARRFKNSQSSGSSS